MAELLPFALFILSSVAAMYLVPKLALSWQSAEATATAKQQGLAALIVAIVSISAVLVTDGMVLAASLLFGWFLVFATIVDIRLYRLPDEATLPLIGLGLGMAFVLPGMVPLDHLFGAVAAYALCRAIAFAYRRQRGQEGLGHGDAKLLAACGAWVTWTGLPTLLLYASLSGLAFALWRRRRPVDTDMIPFGPFIAIGAWLVWLLGPLVGR